MGDDATTSDGGSETITPATSTASTTAPPTGSDSAEPTTTGGVTSADGSTEDSADGSTGGGDDGPNVDVSDPQLYEFVLDPIELDPTVVANLELQYAHLDTRVEPIGKLVFFLPGFTNTPSNWRGHGIQLAAHGFHVVIPDYSNDWSCGGAGGSCNEDTRWEALTGEAVSDIIDIGRADSAEGRVVTILRHLERVHPGGDWGYYLEDDDTLRGEHLIIAGISHGAASTGLYATRRPVSRAVMHSGAWWSVPGGSATPVDVFYALSHADDEQYAGHLDAWEQAGLPGVPTIIEDEPPPYGGSHRLVATTPNNYPHCSVCVSPDSPTDEDGYVFDPAWRHMYGAPQLP
jgi:dienelactone hydrolase